MMAMAVCALVVMSWAGDVQAQCSISQLGQCMGAVTRGSYPSPQCCAQVGAIADFNCFCRMMQNERNTPQAYINNAVNVPRKCGAQGQKLRNRQCGSKLPCHFFHLNHHDGCFQSHLQCIPIPWRCTFWLASAALLDELGNLNVNLVDNHLPSDLPYMKITMQDNS